MALSDSTAELKHLQRSMSDLVSVLALPAVWSGQEPRKIVTTFHDALMATLNLDFLYTRVRIESDGEPIEVLRTAPHYAAKQSEDKIRRALNERFGDDPQKWPASVRSHPGGQEISLLSMQLGIDGEIGMVVAGSERAEFLSQSERLLLVVAANQVTVGLQQARLLSEQKRIANELDRRVAERTRELAEANEVLQLQVGLLQHLPVSAWTLKPDGTPEFVNRVWLEFSGQSLDFVRSHPEAWMTAVHPEDREEASKAFWDGVRSGQSFAFETRSLRAQDGTYRWHLQQAVPLRDAEGRVLKFVGTTTDIDDQKRAVGALRASEANLRRVIDTIPSLSWCNLPDGPNEFLSKGWHDYTGMSPEKAHGWGWSASFHPDDLPPLMTRWQELLVSGEPGEIEARIRRHDGEYRWFLIRVAPFRDETGAILRWYGTSTDIHDRKLADDALRASETSLRNVLDNIPGMVSILGPTGALERSNGPFLEYFNKTHEEIQNWANNDLVHPDDLPRAIASFTRSIETGEPLHLEHRLRRADGAFQWFLSSGRPARNAEGRIDRWYVLTTDIDDRKRAEDELKRSEAKLRETLDSIPALVCSISPEGQVLHPNRQFLEYFGKTKEEMDAWRTNDVIHPDHLERVIAEFTHAVTNGIPLDTEVRYRRADGVYRWSKLQIVPVRDAEGKISVWYGLMNDIDDRKRAEDELKRSEARHRVVVETASDVVVSIDENGKIILASPATNRIFGYAPEELIGKPLTVLMPKAMRGLHEAGFKRYLETGARQLNWQGTEMTAMRADGEEFAVEVSFGEMTTDQGKVFTGFIRDISEKKRAEEELRSTHAEIARMMRVLTVGQLTASIAHEVNQPLSGIVTNASTCLRMLSSDQPNIEGARETARRTIRDGNRASEVVTRLRALFKRKEVAAEPIDLNDAAQEVIALSMSELQSDRILLRHDFAENLPPVKGDRIQIQQVILNLVHNALDAMRGVDDRPRELLIKTESGDNKSVQLTVQDTGIGFASDAADRLFESFYTTKDDGMGIGLSVSRSIIEAHRGRLWASVNDGPGSSFAFSIPSD
jgi:PAS domain S-box-containing protein